MTQSRIHLIGIFGRIASQNRGLFIKSVKQSQLVQSPNCSTDRRPANIILHTQRYNEILQIKFRFK